MSDLRWYVAVLRPGMQMHFFSAENDTEAWWIAYVDAQRDDEPATVDQLYVRVALPSSDEMNKYIDAHEWVWECDDCEHVATTLEYAEAHADEHRHSLAVAPRLKAEDA